MGPSTYSYGEPLDAVVLAVLDDPTQPMVVMRLAISHDDHDLLNPSPGTPGFCESLFPETDKRDANKRPHPKARQVGNRMGTQTQGALDSPSKVNADAHCPSQEAG